MAQVIVYDFSSPDSKKVYDGDSGDIRFRLFRDFPWLLSKFGPGTDIDILVRAIDSCQMYTACISSVELVKCEDRYDIAHAQLYPADVYLQLLRDAAEFLSGVCIDEDKLTEALLETDGNESVSVLTAVGLEPSVSMLDALKGVVSVRLEKSEPEPATFGEVKAFCNSDERFANIVKSASAANTIKTIHFKAGKHSKGVLVAKDPKLGTRLLLKPGSGKQNPAFGEAQVPASQSVREAAFYSVAEILGLGGSLPECRLLYVDSVEFACMTFLSDHWVNGNDLRKLDPNEARRVLSLYSSTGLLHKWAVMDYILGNPDRNAGNVMFRGSDVMLIDHGSALAGVDFKPAFDKRSFVPYYLRVFAPGNFKELTPHEKLRVLPRLSQKKEQELAEWINKIDSIAIQKVLVPYDVDPTPEISRLELLKTAISAQASDMAILQLWVVG